MDPPTRDGRPYKLLFCSDIGLCIFLAFDKTVFLLPTETRETSVTEYVRQVFRVL